MKVGILSDTHDRREAADGAMILFRREGVGMILHLGDVCDPRVLEPIRDSAIPFLGVFGNNDSEQDALQRATGGAFRRGPHIETVDGRTILLAHSYDRLRGELSGQGRFDLVLFGHTHRPLTMRVGKALVLNPGEACGFLGGAPTCAVVDLETMEPRIVGIPLPGAE